MNTASQLIFPAPYKVAYEEITIPSPPGPGQVVAQTVVTGISAGTELAALTGTNHPFKDKLLTADRIFVPKQPGEHPFFPYRYAGYDAVGIVTAVGSGVTTYHVGDRVWAPARHQTTFWFDAASPEAWHLPDSVTNDEAIMLNLSAIALCATNDGEICLGDVVAVFGGGTVGQLAAQLAVASGARRVFLVEPSRDRREFAQRQQPAITGIDPAADVPVLQMRAQNDGRWPDVVLECSGAVAGLRAAIQAAGVGGTVVVAGMYPGPATALSFGEEFLHNRVTLKASMHVWDCPSRHGPQWDRPRFVREAGQLLADKRLNLVGFVSARFPFAKGQEAYDAILADPGRHLKVALDYPRA